MLLDNKVFDDLSARASESERLRMSLDMRNSAADGSQRMLNAIEPGTVIPIHRHRSTSETCIVVRGRAEEIFYDDNGRVTERVVMSPGGDCCGVAIFGGRRDKNCAG
ncbi:MAG: WbuC family cupin fold metalloprotein, partial [Muribaculaceae bacterium]|nr:WbuC family cupin fold metalloprotein [Muribaculaceae bacterium]